MSETPATTLPTSHQGIQEYLESHLDTFMERLESDAMCVYARDEATKSARLVAWRGEKPRESCPYDLPPIGTCAKSGKGLLIERKHSQPEKYQSLIVVPLTYEEFLLGVLYCASVKPEFFKQEKKLAAVRGLADHLGKIWVQPISGGKNN